MTHTWLKYNTQESPTQEWEEGIVAPKITIRALKDELHFYLRIYLKKGYDIRRIISFLFLYLVQRLLYSYSYWSVKYEKPKKLAWFHTRKKVHVRDTAPGNSNAVVDPGPTLKLTGTTEARSKNK